jgi:hypothetical protein
LIDETQGLLRGSRGSARTESEECFSCFHRISLFPGCAATDLPSS